MTIDTKRLATDAAYWRECGAPEDAQEYGKLNGYFYKRESGFWFYWRSDLNKPWQECGAGEPLTQERIPRPQSEWVDGLPTAGCECEVRMHGSQWSKARVVGHDEEGGIPAAVCRVLDSYYAFSSKCIRPTATKAQRDRDELSDLIANNIHIEMQDGNLNVEVGDAVDAAIDAGWTKP